MPFSFERLEITDVVHVEPRFLKDARGTFAELYKITDFQKNGILTLFVQTNHSWSRQGVLRGLHYQKNPAAQAKLVSAARGEIFDVAVDIRKGSPSFGRWVGRRLDADKKNMLFIPEGFAHGFCVLSEEAEVVYHCNHVYSPENERGIAWNDPQLKIEWPITAPTLSDRDSGLPVLAQADNNFVHRKGSR